MVSPLALRERRLREREKSLQGEFTQMARLQPRELFERQQMDRAVAEKAMQKRDAGIWVAYQEQLKQRARLRPLALSRLRSRAELRQAARRNVAFRKWVEQLETSLQSHPKTRAALKAPIHLVAKPRAVVIRQPHVDWAKFVAERRNALVERMRKAQQAS